VTDLVEVENRARLTRTTCGWGKPELDKAFVRRYWRDVHSPAISRRAGIYQYRHSPFDPVTSLFDPVDGIELTCPLDQQLQWQSDVVYLDEAGLDAFLTSPGSAAVRAHLLADIEILVDKSTTYKAVGDNLHTYVDRTGDPTPQGPPPAPRYGVFFRQRAGEPVFRRAMRALAERWSQAPGVLRIRLNVFDRPDMEAERKAGYPVKTHPLELQYQAYMDLVLEAEGAGRELLTDQGVQYSEDLSAVHAYPVPMIYTFVYEGRPTLVGLRGYPAYEAITHFRASNQTEPELLEWMYGPVIHGAGTLAAPEGR
jgi:hypothetical protein